MGFSASAKVRKELGDVPMMKKAGFEQMFKVIFQSQVCVQAHTKVVTVVERGMS